MHIFAQVVFDVLGRRSALGVLSMEESRFASALAKADHDLFFTLAVPRLILMPARDSADIRLVHFEGVCPLSSE